MDVFAYKYILFPMASLVLLTFVVLALLFRSRATDVKEGNLSSGFFKTYIGQDEPEKSRKLSRHFANLFEAPLLFYVVCLAGLSLQLSYGWFQLLAWCYVLIRLAHAVIHPGKNKLPQRIITYFSSWIVLIAMWMLLIYRITGDV